MLLLMPVCGQRSVLAWPLRRPISDASPAAGAVGRLSLQMPTSDTALQVAETTRSTPTKVVLGHVLHTTEWRLSFAFCVLSSMHRFRRSMSLYCQSDVHLLHMLRNIGRKCRSHIRSVWTWLLPSGECFLIKAPTASSHRAPLVLGFSSVDEQWSNDAKIAFCMPLTSCGWAFTVFR